MDFNDIQNAWNNEKNNDVVLPDTMERIKSAHTPLDKIKRNVRGEFKYQMFSLCFLGLVPSFYKFPEKMLILYYLLFSLYLAVCLYYFRKFYFWYKKIDIISLKTKDNLYETYYEIRLNMELYKTFGFALTPFLILYLIGFSYYAFYFVPGIILTEFTNIHLFGLFFIVVFSMLIMGVTLDWWVHKFYGKFAEQIRNVLDELKEE